MTEQSKSITRLHKDNLTNIRSQNEIDWYFDFSNPDWKKRSYKFLTLEIFNFLIIIFALIIFPLTETTKYSFIGVFSLIFIISGVLFRYRKVSYRYLSYIIDIFGLIFVLFIPIYYNTAYEFINVAIVVVEAITVIVDSIFLLNYLTIENARQRFLSPLVRDNKYVNFHHFGKDNWEDM